LPERRIPELLSHAWGGRSLSAVGLSTIRLARGTERASEQARPACWIVMGFFKFTRERVGREASTSSGRCCNIVFAQSTVLVRHIIFRERGLGETMALPPVRFLYVPCEHWILVSSRRRPSDMIKTHGPHTWHPMRDR
jgi:hypothetical protein